MTINLSHPHKRVQCAAAVSNLPNQPNPNELAKVASPDSTETKPIVCSVSPTHRAQVSQRKYVENGLSKAINPTDLGSLTFLVEALSATAPLPHLPMSCALQQGSFVTVDLSAVSCIL